MLRLTEPVVVDRGREWACSNFENGSRALNFLNACTFAHPKAEEAVTHCQYRPDRKSGDCLERMGLEGSDHTVTDQSHLKKGTDSQSSIDGGYQAEAGVVCQGHQSAGLGGLSTPGSRNQVKFHCISRGCH